MLTLTLLAVAPPLVAQETHWTGKDANWLDPGPPDDPNWTNEVPDSSKDAIVDAGVSRIGGPATASQVFVGRSGSGRVVIGDTFFDIIQPGTLSNSGARIGENAGSFGRVNLRFGSSWSMTSSLFVGDGGTGELTIAGGSTVTASSSRIGRLGGSDGTVTVSGIGSLWEANTFFHPNPGTFAGLVVGNSGTGRLTIANGGTVTNEIFVVIASGSESEGTVTVTGAGSTWINNSSLRVGHVGQGELIIDDGGYVENTWAHVAAAIESHSTVTVSGYGSTWQNSGELIVGNGTDAVGELTIAEGGQVSAAELTLGNMAGSAVATVTGPGALLSSEGELWVAFGGSSGNSGTLTIADGGAVTNTDGTVGTRANTAGTVTLSGAGSSWTNEGELIVGASGGLGLLSITDGGVVSSFSGAVGDGSLVSDRPGIGQVTISGEDSTWSNTGELVVATGGGLGDVAVAQCGTMTSAGATLGAGGLNSVGTVTVTGAGSTWTNEGELTLAASGDTEGELIVADGGIVSNTSAAIGVLGREGRVTVSGDQSMWTSDGELTLGGAAGRHGALDVVDGAIVVSGDARLAIQTHVGPRGSAAVNVGGEGSEWIINGQLLLGEFGQAELLIAEGASVSNTFGTIGWDPGATSSVVVTGADARWDNSASLGVGVAGPGELTIANGATATSASTAVGSGAGSMGVAVVSGANSTWTTTDLRVGVAGAGEVTIAEGASVWSSEAVLGASAGAVGIVEVAGEGSTWTSAGGVHVGGGANEAGGAAMLTVTDGGVLEAGQTVLVWGDGSVLGDGEIVAELVVNRGLVAPELPGQFPDPGTLTLDADYQQDAAGRLRIRLVGAEHSRLAVTQNAALDGVLEIVATEAEGVAYWEPVQIVSAGAVAGTFNEVSEPVVDAGTFFHLEYEEQAVVLMPGLLGDMNLDGVVDTGDVAPFVRALTDPAAYEAEYGIDPVLVGDINQDGAFDTGDVAPFVELLVSSDSGAIPEPGSLALLSLGGLMLLRRGGRKPSRRAVGAGDRQAGC